MANLSPLSQEKNTTFDIGYRSLIGEKLYLDVSYYHTSYQDLVVRVSTASPVVDRVFLVYSNIAQKITSNGFNAGASYLINGGYKLDIGYTNTSFNATEALKANSGFLPSFNTPKNRINVGIANSNVAKSNVGFNLKFRYADAYTWQSPFGAGVIPSNKIVDLALTYQLSSLSSMIKLGATNLTGKEYRTVYGGPGVGSIYYVSWTYDGIFGKK